MAARKWTPMQRARQAEKIHSWQPWTKSTGARTPEGKAKSSQNARRFTFRKPALFASWLALQAERMRNGKSHASITEIERRMKLCGIPSGNNKKFDCEK